jgi:mannosyltransferase OCH1-like enzyme
MNCDISNDERWKLLEKLYDKNINSDNKEPRIPKILHQIWLGGELPKLYYYYIDTITKTNPDWEYRLWLDDDVKKFGIQNENLFNTVPNIGSKSDIFRYEILNRFGGVYLDIDFHGVKSFNEIIHLDFFSGTGQNPNPVIYNGLMGTTPNSKLINDIVYELSKIDNVVMTNSIEVMNITGPYFIEREFFKLTDEKDNVIIFPTNYFYPFPAPMRNIPRNSEYNNIINSYNTEKTIATHMWHTNWQK